MKTKTSNNRKPERVWRWVLCIGAFAAIAIPNQSLAQVKIENPPAIELDQKVDVKVFKDAPVPQAVVLAATGKATYSEDGKEFKAIKKGDVLNQGAIVRTDEGGSIDLYFRRTGMMTRLSANTEVALERMGKLSVGSRPTMEASLELRSGGLFCFVRTIVPDIKFELTHKSPTEGVAGLQVRSADGSFVPKYFFTPPASVSETAITVVVTGSQLDSRWSKALSLPPSEAEKSLIELDELKSISDKPDRRQETSSR